MKLKQIVNQLRAVLPKYTSRFSNTITLDSLISSGSTATATKTSHGFLNGEYVTIKGAKIPYIVESLTRVGTQATIITTNDNQVTFEEDGTVEISGANESDYNGTKTLIESKRIEITSLTKSGDTITAVTSEDHGFIVNSKFEIKIWGAKQQLYNQNAIVVASTPTSTSFTYTIKGETISPATTVNKIYCQALNNKNVFFFEVENNPTTPATGTIYQLLSWNGGYNGAKTITLVDPDTFTYILDISPLNSPAQGTITVDYGTKVDGAVNLTRAIESYTSQSQNVYWAFVVINPTVASKNRKELTNATTVIMDGQRYEQNVLYNFDIFVFIPSGDSVAGAEEFDDAQDLLRPILKSVAGVSFDSPLNEHDSGTYTKVTFSNEGFERYEKAFYIHRFNFNVTGYILNPDIVDEFDSYAFRGVDETYVDKEGDALGHIAKPRF